MSDTLRFQTVQLYGGAMSVSLPADFADVSSIRDVPDHQEVWLSRHGLSSIIFDIVERAEPPEHPECTSDVEALKYHYKDIISTGFGREGSFGELEEETREWGSATVELGRLPQTPAFTVFATQHPIQTQSQSDPRDDGAPVPVSNPSSNSNQKIPDFTAVLLTLIRLEAQKTDICISINVPHVRGEEKYDQQQIDLTSLSYGPLLEEAMEVRRKVWESFEIRDWGLFVQ